MSTITIQAAGPFFTQSPRGARWAAEVFSRVLSAFDFSREVAVAPLRSRTQEAESVRAMARQVEASDPGFASDLYAAANRHEALDD